MKEANNASVAAADHEGAVKALKARYVRNGWTILTSGDAPEVFAEQNVDFVAKLNKSGQLKYLGVVVLEQHIKLSNDDIDMRSRLQSSGYDLCFYFRVPPAIAWWRRYPVKLWGGAMALLTASGALLTLAINYYNLQQFQSKIEILAVNPSPNLVPKVSASHGIAPANAHPALLPVPAPAIAKPVSVAVLPSAEQKPDLNAALALALNEIRNDFRMAGVRISDEAPELRLTVKVTSVGGNERSFDGEVYCATTRVEYTVSKNGLPPTSYREVVGVGSGPEADLVRQAALANAAENLVLEIAGSKLNGESHVNSRCS